MLVEKSKSLDASKTFKSVIELGFGKKIKYVNSDKGGEFYRRYNKTRRNPSPFDKYLQDCGIEVNYTMPRIPEQITVKRNQMLMDMVRCMLAHSLLPNFL